MHRTASLLILGALVAACSKSSPDTQPEPEVIGARINNTLEEPIARGDCTEAVRRAVANPNVDVEKVASPIAMTPQPIDGKKMPKGVADRNGWFKVQFHVVVDTTGKADMKTFAIDTASHPWLATSVKTAVAKWSFRPAEVAGCRIPRHYSLGISPKGKSRYVAGRPAAKIPTRPAAKKPPVV